MPIDYDEKRDFYRMQIDCNVTYTVDGAGESLHGQGKDLSAKGVQFVANTALDIGTEMSINVLPTLATVEPLDAKARVVRVESVDGDQYITAVEFIQVT